MPDDATEGEAEHSSRLQPSMNLHAPVRAFMFSCSDGPDDDGPNCDGPGNDGPNYDGPCNDGPKDRTMIYE